MTFSKYGNDVAIRGYKVVECCILLVYAAGENENTIFPGLID